MSITKLFLSVSVIAMFAVGSAWATDPKNTSDTNDTVATSHSADIYPSALRPITTAEDIAGAVSQFKDSGIAGVTYVNRMVGVAGGAAQKAEEHAAAAGASAIDAQTAAGKAKESADAATSALANKQDKATAVKVTESGTAVGSATVPVYVDSTGLVKVITSYSGKAASATEADSAAKATADASGNVITSTYATKSELTTGLSGKQDTLEPNTNIKGSGSVAVTKTGEVITVFGTDNDTTYTAGTNVTITGENNAINVATANGGNLGVMKWGQVPSGSPTSTTSAQIWIE